MGYTFRFFVLRQVSMPWKASSVIEERLGFVARLLDGEAMTDIASARSYAGLPELSYPLHDRHVVVTAYEPLTRKRSCRGTARASIDLAIAAR
jgi:hypothetical protein